ncbi:OPT/YSL family transporter [Leptotrichia buccalis]|jgi:oligopeptide transporters, OPT superfamily|uniref:Oligopeptide transporters, OPT superfamily n=1 Tax=Leptotrichia buccalis (strain ATCC 14201 / DSM 1135 / JCM 12969 / NCTC 10249 / C-1013-b) TaxID=523794 RepID=C7N9X8_LEPBD|nr:OPT/YSL family transporter [Leptotrichia buccalis]ACV38959.1 oligopeptide transporters, OPT superfamily [Leptotrichia buccalis C-1013-b]
MTEEKKLNITFPAVFIGIVGAILVSASSFYIVLKFGALPWPTIMVTLLSMITLKFFKRTDNKEITITHTIMSAGSMVAGGVAFTVPAYIILGGKLSDINQYLLCITILVGSIAGSFLSYIFRSKLIEEEKLEFPIGEAAYNLVKSGENMENIRYVAFGTLFSSIIALFRDFSFSKGKPPFIPALLSLKNGLLSLYVSPLLVGIGYVLGFVNTFVWFLGGAVIVFIGEPLAKIFKLNDFAIMKNSFGMGFMIGIGIAVILKIIFSNKSKNEKNNQNIFKKLSFLSIFSIIIIILIYKLPIFLALVLILISILCTIIAGYSTGKTGVNPMEIYAIITILLISFLNKILNGLNIFGIKFSADLTTLTLFLLACIIAVACGLSGDILNDFKSGYRMNVNPKDQLVGELIGSIVSSFVITFLFFVFFRIYKNIGPVENTDLIALQASIVATVINGIPFLGIFFAGLIFGMVLSLLNLPVLTFGIGIYVPFYLTSTVFLGGLISYFANRHSKKLHSNLLLLSNGLMSGEAIVGVILSVAAYIGLFMK